jgi:hypothetical protein
VQKAFARVRVFQLAATFGILSTAAFATATPAGMFTPPPGLLAALASKTDVAAPPSRESAALAIAVAALSGQRDAQASYASLDALPTSGVLTRFTVLEPRNEHFPTETFARGTHLALGAPAFVRPAATAVALGRLPLMKPEAEWPISRGAVQNAPIMLAYAPATSGIEEPFDALMGNIRPSADEAMEAWRPRPRPDPDTVLGWLEGRALGQFAPGQHAWVQNPLPESVHNAKQQKCLAEGIYFEARSESESGQAAVAQVILNRVRNPAYPDTICDVVYQNKDKRNACQFSFACDGIKDRVRSKRAWRVAQRIAKDVTDGKIWLEEIGDSTHYYAYYVRPGWASRMIKADRIGAHLFYRTKRGGWS